MNGQLLMATLVACLLSFAAFAREATFESQGHVIRYIDEGRGTPIILLHGQNSSIEASWTTAGVVADLARDYRVIAFDFRGHGKSAKPRDPSAYGREIGLDAIRLLDHLGIEKAHFVGYSLGAILTSQLLTTHPQRFLSAALVGAGPRFKYTEENRASDEIEATERERDCTSRTFLTRLSPPGSPPMTDEAFAKVVQDCKANAMYDQFAVAAYIRTKKDQVISEADFASAKVRMLGVVGSLDPLITMLREAERLQPSMTIIVIHDATHFGPKRAHARPEFLKEVREFLASQK